MSKPIIGLIYKKITGMRATFNIHHKKMEVSLPVDDYIQLMIEQGSHFGGVGGEIHMHIHGSWVHILPQFDGIILSHREAITLYGKIHKTDVIEGNGVRIPTGYRELRPFKGVDK